MSMLLMSWSSTQKEKEEIKRKKKKIRPEEEKWKKEKEKKEKEEKEEDEKPKKRLRFEYSEEDRKKLSQLVHIEKNWDQVIVHSIKWIKRLLDENKRSFCLTYKLSTKDKM